MSTINVCLGPLFSSIPIAYAHQAADKIYKVDVVSQPPQSWLFTLYVVCTFVLALVSVITAWIVLSQRKVMAEQLDTMRDQLKSMREAGEQTDKLIKENIKQTEALRDGVSAANVTAQAAQTSANAADSSAKTLLNSERAWVEVRLKPSGPYFYQWIATNYGRTPAKVTHYYFKWDFPRYDVPSPDPETLFAPTIETTTAASRLLGQNDPWEFNHFNIMSSIKQDTLARINRKEIGFVLYGVFSYDDMAGRSHESTFYYVFDVAAQAFNPINNPAYRRFT
jgi:hypothetical protein